MTKKKGRKRPAREAPGKAVTTQTASPLDRPRAFRNRDRGDLIHIGVVFAVAFALRMLFFYLNKRNNPVFYHPIIDALYHHEWAIDILEGPTKGTDVFYRGPFYPYMLAVLYWISDTSIAFAVFVQHLMGSLTAVLGYLLAREYFAPRVALFAGLGTALYWPLIYFEGDLLIVTTFVFLNALAFLLFAKAQKQNRLALYAAAGFVIGVSAITRPSIFAFYLVGPLIIYLTSRNRPPGTADWKKRTLVVAAAASVAIAPVMVRNYIVGGAIVPVAASGGVNFYIGNNPASDGSTAVVPGTRADFWGGYEDAIAIAARELGPDPGLAAVSDYYFKRGMEFIGSRPDEAWPHMLRKLRVFWSGPERANNKFIYFFWDLAGMKYIPLPGFPLVTPLGILGMFLLWPRRRELSLLYLFVLSYSLGVVAFFVNARFRLPVMPIIIIFAAYAVAYIVAHYRERSARNITALVVLAFAAVLVNAEFMWFKRVRAYSNAISHSTLGGAYLEMGLKDTALRHYQMAHDINAENPTTAYDLIARDVNYHMGAILWEQGLCSRAIEVLEQVGGNDLYAIAAQDYLGDCYLWQGDVPRALAAYRRLQQIDPEDMRGATGLGRCYLALGDYAKAEEYLTPLVKTGGAIYAPAWMALAQVQRATGRIDEAIESYRGLSRFSGYEKDALLALAEIYGQLGRYDDALDALNQARNYAPTGDPAIQSLINQFRARR